MGEKDAVEKILMSYNDVFADIVNGLLFCGEQIVSAEELVDYTPYGYYKAAGRVRGQERDIAKRWDKGGVCFSCIGIENQTEPDPDMPIRVMAYDAVVYRNQLGKNMPRRHYPVVSLVLYLGYEEQWTESSSLKGCLDIPPMLEEYVSDYAINVFPIANLTRDMVNRFSSDFRAVADYYVQKCKNKDYNPELHILCHAREVMHYLSIMERDDQFEIAYNEMLTNDPAKEGGCTMCDVLERVKNSGKAEGIEQGIERGVEQERERNVQALAVAGHTSQEIADWLHLDIQYVQSVRQNKAQ